MPADPSAISVAYHEENTQGEEICKAIELKLKNYKVHNELVMIWKKTVSLLLLTPIVLVGMSEGYFLPPKIKTKCK
jgi:hypothetical protein